MRTPKGLGSKNRRLRVAAIGAGAGGDQSTISHRASRTKNGRRVVEYHRRGLSSLHTSCYLRTTRTKKEREDEGRSRFDANHVLSHSGLELRFFRRHKTLLATQCHDES